MIVKFLKELKLIRGISNQKIISPLTSKNTNKSNSYKNSGIIIPFGRTWNYEWAKHFS